MGRPGTDGQLTTVVQAVSGSIALTRADDVTAEGDIAVGLEDGTQLEGHFLASSECLRERDGAARAQR